MNAEGKDAQVIFINKKYAQVKPSNK